MSPAGGETACPDTACLAAAENLLLLLLAHGSYRAGKMLAIKSPKETTFKAKFGFTHTDPKLTMGCAFSVSR